MDSAFRDNIQAWLGLQTSMVTGVTRAAILLGDAGAHPGKPTAVWPEQSVMSKTMSAVAQQAVQRRLMVVNSMAMAVGSDVGPACDIMAFPLIFEGRPIGSLCFEMTARTEAKQRTAMQVFTWGMVWLEMLVRQMDQSAAHRLGVVIEIVAKAVAHDRFGASSISVANELVRQLSCERVSVGFRDGREMRIAAISNTAHLEEKTSLVRGLAAAMNEAVDQDRLVAFPVTEGSQVLTQAHEQLKTRFGSRVICTVPLAHDGEAFGAITLERSDDLPFDADTLSLCETIASMAGPILRTKRLEQLSWSGRVQNALRTHLGKLFGQGHLTLKVGALAAACLLLFLVIAKGEYRINADAKLEGTIQRVVIAPFDGYVAEAAARHGDIVKEGQLLARLDDRDLKLEYAKWSSERAKIVKEQRQALAEHEHAELSILQAQLDQADASLALAEEKLARTRLSAPLDGIVVSGDLSQSLGAPLERGDVLFEVAPLEGYRILLEVDEREITQVQPGQQGELALSGLPHQLHAFTVERILPVSTAAEGQNFFRVEAALYENATLLRPGMAGVGKIDAGERRLIWIWGHELTDWLRLSIWRWWG